MFPDGYSLPAIPLGIDVGGGLGPFTVFPDGYSLPAIPLGIDVGGPDNRLAEKGWTTRKNTHGHTEWLPPPHLDHGQPRTNTFHHPERFLHNQDDDDKPD